MTEITKRVDLTCPFRVRYVEYGHEDIGGEFETDTMLNLLLNRFEPMIDEGKAVEEFKKWFSANADRNFKVKPILYKEQVICEMI